MPTTPTSEPTTRGRGRPARLQRGEIVRLVARQLADHPDTPLTMARAADAVGASPMALYRHFRDRDDLVVALVQHVLGDVRAVVEAPEPWTARVAAWMQMVYARALEYPQLFRTAASADSVAWLPSATALAAILDDAGFADDRARAEAVYWVSTTSLGHAMVAVTLGSELRTDVLEESVATLEADTAQRAAALIPHLADISRRGFELVIAQTLAALEATVR